MLRAIETLRLYTLVFTVPATVLWARTLGPATGSLLVATHAMLVLFYSAWSVKHDVERGLAPRLGLVRRRRCVSGEILDGFVPIGALLTGLLAIALFFSNFWIGLGAILALGAAVWHGRQPKRDKYVRVELIASIGLLAGPGLLFHLHAWEPPKALQVFSEDPEGPAELTTSLTGRVVRPEVISNEALAATLLAAAALLIVILLCLLRDRSADIYDGIETAATRFGWAGAAAMAWVWTLGVMLLATIGVGAGWWHWSTALLAAWGGAGTLTALAVRREDVAVWVWLMAGGAMAVVATTTV